MKSQKEDEERMAWMAENSYTCEVCHRTYSRDEVTIRRGDSRVMCDKCYKKHHCELCGIAVFPDEPAKRHKDILICNHCHSSEVNAGERWDD